MPTVPTLDPLAVAGTLCARICHDLAGSIGTLTSALEMAAEDGDREALDLALSVSREMSARLQVLRAAWSSGSDVPPLATLYAGLPGAERLQVETSALQAADTEILRLCLSLLLVAAAGLRRGGMIRLAGTDTLLTLEIEGKSAAWPASLAPALDDEAGLRAAAGDPRDVAVALACLQARAIGRRIVLDSPTRLHLVA